MAALGTRGVILEALNAEAEKVRRTVQLLLDAASQGDLAAAKLVLPYVNQALGNPTETVAVATPSTADEVASLPTAALVDIVRERRRRAGLQAVPDESTEQASTGTE